MSGPNYVKQPTIQRLPTQLEEIRNGHLLIPRFQRPFVWTDEQRLNLLDSVYRGMPIGSILVWRTYNHKLSCYDRLGPLPIATQPFSDTEVKQYLLDGHQRLTTLYVAFHSGSDLNPNNGDEDKGERQWPICFDLENQRFQLQPHTGDTPKTWVPLSILFDSFKLFAFQKQLFDLPNGEELTKRAESLAAIFKDYSIAVVPIVTEDLEVVTQSFQRINSAGTPMSQVHMVSALTWKQDFDLTKKFEAAHEILGEIGWKDIENDMLLNACKVEFGLDVYSSKVNELKEKINESPTIIEKVTAQLTRAAVFLRKRCGVYGPQALPYRLQILALAHALPESPNENVEEVLTKWFWITTYTEYVGSGTNSLKLARALKHIKDVVHHGADPIPPDAITQVKPIDLFHFPNGRARAIALQLARLAPRSPNDKAFAAARNLGSKGNDAVLRLVRTHDLDNRRLGRRPENRIIILPEYLARFRAKLAKAQLSQRILDSHAITAEAAAAYANGEYDTFLRLRRQHLLDLEEQFVASLGLIYDRKDVVDQYAE